MTSSQEIEVLRSINLLEIPTRAEIARSAHLSTVSVTSLLARLQRRCLVEPAGKTHSSGGRPSVIYRLAPDAGCSIGVFFECTSCHVAAIDASGAVVAERVLPLALSDQPADHAHEIVEQVSEGVKTFIRDRAIAGRRVLAIGVAPPGMVDTRRGVWLHGLRLSGIEHVDLRTMLEQALGRPVLVEDGARCLAHLAVRRLGREEGGDLLLLYLGSGVGAGLVLSAGLYRGGSGLAGEVGHLVVEERGERCGCGNAGCLETVASQPAILRRFRRRLEEGVISRLQDVVRGGRQELTLEAIAEAAGAGDRLALGILADVGSCIGDACGTSIMLYNPRTLCISGPVAALGEYLRDPLWSRIRQQVIPEMLTGLRLEIVPSRPGDESRGAAELAAQWFWDTAAGRGSDGAAGAAAAREVFG